MSKFEKMIYAALMLVVLAGVGLLSSIAKLAHHLLLEGTWTLGLIGLFIFSYLIVGTVQRR